MRYYYDDDDDEINEEGMIETCRVWGEVKSLHNNCVGT